MPTEQIRKKIVYVITKGSWGGASRYVFDLARYLPKNDYQVTVVCGQGQDLPAKLSALEINCRQIPTLQRDINWSADWQSLWQLRKIFREEQADIVHLNSSKAGLLGAIAGRLAGRPKIIFTAHGWSHNEKIGRTKKIIRIISHWLCLILCHQIIAVSEKTKQDVSHWPGIKHKLRVIYNGVAPIPWLTRKLARQKLLADKQDKFWIGVIAELHHNKGQDVLLTAFIKTIKNLLGDALGWKIILVLIGEGETRQQLEQQIKDSRLTDRIFLLGHQPEAAQYLPAFDLMVLPSRTEALPYTALEAGVAGVPLVASEVGGLSEIIPDPYYGLLVPPENSEELSKSLIYVIKKDGYRQTISQNLKKRVTENFSLKSMVEQTRQLYDY